MSNVLEDVSGWMKGLFGGSGEENTTPKEGYPEEGYPADGDWEEEDPEPVYSFINKRGADTNNAAQWNPIDWLKNLLGGSGEDETVPDKEYLGKGDWEEEDTKEEEPEAADAFINKRGADTVDSDLHSPKDPWALFRHIHGIWPRDVDQGPLQLDPVSIALPEGTMPLDGGLTKNSLGVDVTAIGQQHHCAIFLGMVSFFGALAILGLAALRYRRRKNGQIALEA